MRNTIYIFLILSVLSFGSCDDDSEIEEETVENSLLVGTWTMTGLTYDGVSTVTDSDGLETQTEFIGEAEAIDITLIFEQGPNVYTSAGSYVIPVTSELFGQEVMQDLVFNNFLGDGTWEEENNVLMTMDANNGENRETAILVLTDNGVIFEFSLTNTMMVQDLEVEQVILGVAIFSK